MMKFTYEEFKAKIRESLKPRPVAVAAQKSRTLLETLHNNKPLKKYMTLKLPEIR